MNTAENINTSGRWPIRWVETQDQLTELIELLNTEEILSLDTETAGWQTGNEHLCLIQIGLPTTKEVAIIDPLTVEDLSPLEPIMSKSTPEIIAHNASFEERQLARHGIKIRGIIDTLTMARDLRPDLPNFTLRTCCKLLLDVDLDKEQQVSDWSQRPLSKAQIDYAALDAEIALKLFWVLDEMESKLAIDPALKVPELMSLLHSTVRERIDLTHDIASELALLHAREDAIREGIRAKLIEGEKPYEGELGACKVTKVKRTEVNPAKVRKVFPNIADMVITDHVERKHLKAVMKEAGIDVSKLDLVLDIIGYNDRMSLSLKDVV